MVGDAVKAKIEANKTAEKQKKQEIPLVDKILLGPIDKYRKYNRFPWKFLLHIIMIIITTFQVLYVTTYSSNFAYNARLYWNFLFMTAPDGTIMDVGQPIYLYTTTSMIDFVQNTVDNYYALNSTVVFDNITQASDPETG